MPGASLNCRVLAIVPHHRFGGYAALDREGIVPGTFRGWNLRRQSDPSLRNLAARDLVARLVRRVRPKVIVIGTLPAHAGRVEEMPLEFGALAVPVVTRSVRDAQIQVVGRIARRRGDGLAVRLVRNFFPDMAVDLGGGVAHERFHRHAWSAAVVALAEFASCDPVNAAQLLRLHTQPPPDFLNTLRLAHQNLHPHLYAATA